MLIEHSMTNLAKMITIAEIIKSKNGKSHFSILHYCKMCVIDLIIVRDLDVLKRNFNKMPPDYFRSKCKRFGLIILTTTSVTFVSS